jgi:hypothetical protein
MTIYVPSRSASDWKALLRDPDKQWVTAYSARTLAHCWEAARGVPPEHSAMDKIEPLLVVPERTVFLDNERAPSQNDVWVLASAAPDLVSIAIEGKVNEPFDVTLGEWKRKPSGGRTKRLAFLAQKLGLTEPIPDSIRYQLLHRAASAVIEAERFHAKHAVMIVHSFSKTDLWFADFVAFSELFGVHPNINQLITASTCEGANLHLAWVHGDERFLEQCNCCP